VPVESDGIFRFKDKPYDMYYYSIISEKEDRLLIELVLKNTKMPFYFEDSGIYLVGTLFKTYNEMKDIPSIGFKGNEQFGSGRGYIWSRSLPLLKDTFWIGHGPDTFPMYYPQDDIIGKLNTFRDIRAVVDKPHSFYIQVAHNTGVISLLALLVLFGFYLIQSVKLYWKRRSSDTWVIAGKIIMGAVLAYLITSIFNDSVIYVAPIFWTLLGAGFAVNYQVKQLY
ncbi:MAG: O-antigen ligase family protein, partial [Clostridiaceae bacterium]|nr:O-antigen ligase family protein [Clostridiaceae bacterium]